MKKLIRAAALLPAFLFAASASHAFFFGDPGRSIRRGKSTLGFDYDSGSRDIVPKGGGKSTNLDSRRFAAQFGYGMGGGAEFIARAVPYSGRLDFGGDYDPAVGSMGLGLKWAPPEPIGPVHVGVQGTADVSFGKKTSAESTWTEWTLAAGGSVEVTSWFRPYGGFSLMNSDIQIVSPDAPTAKYENDDSVGGFMGASFIANEAWTLGVELHFSNEQSVGFGARYFF